MKAVHPLVWVGWLVAALAALSGTRNPLHLILTMLCVGLVNAALGGRGELGHHSISPARFALIVIPLSGLFNAATAHSGDTVLLRLPPRWPLVGGPITLEALVFGMINGLVLSGILAAFTTFIRALPIRALIRLIPRAFYPVAVVISIGLTFIPVTMRQFQQIREAQTVRGHRVRGLRDWLPLLMPLLIGGLERALQLAEAMTARGFASTDETGHDTGTRGGIVMGLAALLGGWLLRLVWGQVALGLSLMLGGSGLIVAVLWAVGRQTLRTTYRPEPWTRWDAVIGLGLALVLVAYVLPGLDRASLLYYPYPSLSLPRFDPLIGAATLGLLAPAFLPQNVPSKGHVGVG